MEKISYPRLGTGKILKRNFQSSEATEKSYRSAETIANLVAKLVSGDRARTHGNKIDNHWNIARLWNAYLDNRIRILSARDVAIMMVLLKIARTKLGAHNPDDYIDMCGYAAVAGEIAENESNKHISEAEQGDQFVIFTSPSDHQTKIKNIHSRRSTRKR